MSQAADNSALQSLVDQLAAPLDRAAGLPTVDAADAAAFGDPALDGVG